ncbi:MAG: response regulator [Bacteroidota bacterium]
MKITSLKIGKQLVIAFAIMLALVVTLGITSYFQSQRLHDQTSTMYLHPFQVQNAIGNLRADILSIHRDIKDFLISGGQEDMDFSLNRMSGWENDALEQIQILHRQYLGPKADIDSVENTMRTWNSMRATTIRLLQAGSFEEAAKRTERYGTAGKQVEVILKAIDKVDEFATKKAENLFQNSITLNDALNKQLLLLVTLILVITVLINFTLLRNIRTPLIELTDTTRRFHSGDLTARNSYKSENEFGVLSATFNTLAASIEESLELNEKTSSLSRLMISENDEKEFFYATLAGLAMHTHSQMAAIYLLSDDKKNFCHFESIGLDENARQKFSATNYEGEFGTVLSTRKIQHIKNLPEDTRFIFHAVSGNFIAHEILSIPVIAGDEIIGIISLASINKYSKQKIRLVENIHDLLNARIEGVLAYSRINAFSSKMELQNHELEAQKAELYSQSTELLGQNTELEMQKAQLNEANRLKTNFLSNMSHELRTPLNSVIALSGVLSRRLANQIPDEEYSYLEVIERNGKNLLVLINDILDISRIEAGREEIDITTFSIDSLLADVISMIIPQADEKNVGLIQTVNNSELVISSDHNKIRHILQNLIGNAVKFTDEGAVKVVAEKTESGIVITVSDTGIGIAEEHMAHIFDEFRQADGSTSRRFGGSGLGLAIAKKYANLLGGSISVESSVGEGSRFMLILPLRYTSENKISAEVKPSEFKNKFYQAAKITDPNVAKKTILLVEDSEPAIIQMKDILDESGYTILSAHNGSEALQIISTVIPDAMILDLMMPGMDGFEVLKTLREVDRTAGIPVLILTAKHITKEELSTLKSNNIHQLIQKGDVNRHELLNAVWSMVKDETTHTSKPGRELPSFEGRPLVLVVEDNPDNMITVKALLSDHFDVIEAIDGNEGFAMARKHRPHFILMDIALPEMDGIAAFRAIRNEAKLQHIPVIALTASAMTSDREIILAHGFDAYIAKPIDDKLFFKTINNVLYGI